MKRVLPALLSLAATAVLAIPPSAHAALGLTQVGQFKLSAALNPDGSVPHLSLKLPAGLYDITSIGTYQYGLVNNEPYLADAACSQGGISTWDDPLDVMAHGGAPVSNWHMNRYFVNGDYFTKGGGVTYNSGAELLSIYVNGQPANWVPTFPTVATDGTIPAGCNTTTHQYDTVVASDGTNPVVLNVYDLNYADNADVAPGGMTIQVGKLTP